MPVRMAEDELPDRVDARRHRILGSVWGGGRPGAGARVWLVGKANTLGVHRAGAQMTTAHVVWTRAITGFEGTLRQCWSRYVAHQVAGLNWAAFRAEFAGYNPGFDGGQDRLAAEAIYRLPENQSEGSEVVWDRRVTGLTGTVWQIWQQAVAQKVVGLGYEQFKAEWRQQQPHLARGAVAGDVIRLPRNRGAARYYLFTISGARGGFRFEDVPPGRYSLRVEAAGMEPFVADFVAGQGVELRIVLTPVGENRLPVAPDVRDEDMASRTAGERRRSVRSGEKHPWVGVHNDELVAGDRPFRFVGVNLRGLVHYGDGQTLEHAQTGHQAEQLQAAFEMGARVARVFVASAHVGVEETIRRLRDLVGLVRARYPGLYLLPLFANLYNSVPFRMPGDDGFFARSDPHFPGDLLNADFFTHGYRRNYLPFVRAVVGAFRDEPVIMAWEIGNELKLNPAAGHSTPDDPHLNAFIRFMHTAAEEIRQLDPNHLITTGMISTHHAWLHNDLLQRRLLATPHFDFLTVHCYNEEYENDDSRLAATLNKPYIVEEAGFGRGYGSDRSGWVRQDMDFWFGRRARGYLQWGFMAPRADMGDGDQDSGMDRVFHGDWDALFSVYRARADELARTLPEWRVEPQRPGMGNGSDAGDSVAGFAPGQRVFAQVWLNVRSAPGHLSGGGEVLGQTPPGTGVMILGAAVVADGLVWWPVETLLGDGRSVAAWAAQALPTMVLLGVQPPEIPRGIDNGTGIGTARGVEDAASRAVARAAQAVVGQARFTLFPLNLRREPGFAGKPDSDVLGIIPNEAQLEILRTPVEADGLVWYLVRGPLSDNSVAVGWVAERGPDGTLFLASARPEPVRPPLGGTLGPELAAGDVVQVLVEQANVRRSPDLGNHAPDHILGTVHQGAQLTVSGRGQIGDGIEWVPVRTHALTGQTVEGWVALTTPNGTRILARNDLARAIRVLRPFAPLIPMSQGWGLRPDVYRSIRYDGVPLKGHNGVDFGMRTGTPILATDAGEVLRIAYEKDGFGHHILLRHTWGESLYAHLEAAPTVEGRIEAGQLVGISGESGFSQGAHLHFGIRIFPYRRTDGWGGFVNPVPLMRAEDLVAVRGMG